jgi:hypothetical protein
METNLKNSICLRFSRGKKGSELLLGKKKVAKKQSQTKRSAAAGDKVCTNDSS